MFPSPRPPTPLHPALAIFFSTAFSSDEVASGHDAAQCIAFVICFFSLLLFSSREGEETAGKRKREGERKMKEGERERERERGRENEKAYVEKIKGERERKIVRL